MTFLALIISVLLAITAGTLALFGTNTIDRDDRDFFRLVLVLVAITAGWSFFCLSNPAQHHTDLVNIANNIWYGVILVALAKGVFEILDGGKFSIHDVTEVATLCAMLGAIGTRASELTKSGTHPDLHSANVLLTVSSFIFLLAFIVTILMELKSKKDAAIAAQLAEERAQERRDAASAVQAPSAACTTDADHWLQQHAPSPGPSFRKEL